MSFQVARLSQVHQQLLGLDVYHLALLFLSRSCTLIQSISDKIALMISLADGELVRHCHAGIFVEEPGRISSHIPKKKRRSNSRGYENVHYLSIHIYPGNI